MADDELDTHAADAAKRALERWSAAMVSALARDGEDAHISMYRMMALSDEVKRREVSIDLLYSIVPDAADPELWMQWIQGGSSPRHRLKMQQFDAGPANSGRKIKAALNDVTSRTAKLSEARLRLEQAREEMVEAERALERAEQQEKIALDMARGVTAWAYLNEVARVALGVFSMGPAWTLMRVVSGHLQENSEWEKGLPEDERVVLSQHRSLRQERSDEMLGILDSMSGDPAFEVSLFERLYEWLEPYAETAAQRGTRSSRARKPGLNPLARTDDASSVAHRVSR
jgi:hypothetical protein